MCMSCCLKYQGEREEKGRKKQKLHGENVNKMKMLDTRHGNFGNLFRRCDDRTSTPELSSGKDDVC